MSLAKIWFRSSPEISKSFLSSDRCCMAAQNMCNFLRWAQFATPRDQDRFSGSQIFSGQALYANDDAVRHLC